MEDLWAFNDERVAYAIFESHIPIISAVGHEPDITISDYVADLRAATPSNAAELAVPDQDALRQTMDNMTAAMASSLDRQLKNARKHLNMLSQSHPLKSSDGYIDNRRNALHQLQHRMISAQINYLSGKKHRFISSIAKLDAMSPLKVLTRGYSIAQLEDGTLLRSVCQAEPGDPIRISLTDGKISATVTKIGGEV